MQAIAAVPGDYCQGNKDFSFKPKSLPLSASDPGDREPNITGTSQLLSFLNPLLPCSGAGLLAG